MGEPAHPAHSRDDHPEPARHEHGHEHGDVHDHGHGRGHPHEHGSGHGHGHGHPDQHGSGHDHGHGHPDEAERPRTLPQPAADFSGDTGEADAALVAALLAYLARPGEDADRELARVLQGSRLLVPVVPQPGPQGEPAAKGAEMVTMILSSPTGERALPVFSSLAALSAWSPQARPLPVLAEQAALAAAQEDCTVMLIDLGSDHEVVLRPTMLWALAEERPWCPAHADPVVQQAVRAALAGEECVQGATLRQGEPLGAGVLLIELTTTASVTPEQLTELTTRIGGCLARDPQVRPRIDVVRFTRTSG